MSDIEMYVVRIQPMEVSLCTFAFDYINTRKTMTVSAIILTTDVKSLQRNSAWKAGGFTAVADCRKHQCLVYMHTKNLIIIRFLELSDY